jgi:hypothetical protein
MGIAWLEPYDLYPAIVTAGVGFSSTWNCSATSEYTLVTGLISGVGQALHVSNGNTRTAFRSIPLTKQVSIAFYLNTNLPDGVVSQPLFDFATALGVRQCTLRLTPGGLFQLIGEGGATIATATLPITENTVNHISMRLDITTPGSNTFELYLNGGDTPALAASNADLQDDADTQIGGFTLLAQGFAGLTGTLVWDIDHMICLYDEYVVIPELELYYIGPNSDDSVQFTRLSGASNFNMVDDTTIDSDTTYNHSNTPGDKDKFGLIDPTFVSDYVWCVSSVTTARKEESSTQTLKNLIDKGGVDYESPNIFLSTGYTINYTHNQTDPSTSLAWNPADISGLKSGYQLTTGL